MDTGLANHQPVPKARDCFLVSLHYVVVCLLLREVHILSIEAFPCWFIGWPCASCGYAVRCWYHCQLSVSTRRTWYCIVLCSLYLYLLCS